MLGPVRHKKSWSSGCPAQEDAPRSIGQAFRVDIDMDVLLAAAAFSCLLVLLPLLLLLLLPLLLLLNTVLTPLFCCCGSGVGFFHCATTATALFFGAVLPFSGHDVCLAFARAGFFPEFARFLSLLLSSKMSSTASRTSSLPWVTLGLGRSPARSKLAQRRRTLRASARVTVIGPNCYGIRADSGFMRLRRREALGGLLVMVLAVVSCLALDPDMKGW